MPSLEKRIGKRTVVVDANLPVHLAQSLRRKGFSVVHVVEVNPKMPDIQIQAMMRPTDVILTCDRRLYIILRPNAIFLTIGKKTRRRVAFAEKLQSTLEYEQSSGITEFRIRRGMKMLFS